MGKHNKHKKKLRAEKTKTQLKKTKFLPKGQNVTNTTFKIKPIVLPTQLENEHNKHSNEYIKELISKLNHHHDGTKVHVCEELVKLIPNVRFVGNTLPVLLGKLGAYTQEKSPKARKEGLKALDEVLKRYGDQIEPYFQRLCLNLKCAMTDIDRNVQEDSILFFDALLKNLPDLTARNFHRILPDFLNLISKLKNDSDIKRTLTDNLRSKFTSLDWRFIVLSRLNAFLDAINSSKCLIKDEVVTIHESDRGMSLRKSFPALWDPWNPDEFTKTSSSLSHYVPNLIPLLYEFWLEGNSTENCPKIVSCIVRVLHKLWIHVSNSEDLNERNSLRSNEVEKLLVKLLESFPYRNNEQRSKKTNSFMDAFRSDDQLTDENLLICFLYLSLFDSLDHWKKITDYLKKYLKSNTNLSKYLFSTLRIIFIDKVEIINNVRPLMDYVVVCYENLDKRNRLEILRLLSDIESQLLLRCESFDECVTQLPLLFCGNSIEAETIEMLGTFSRKNIAGYNETFWENRIKIVENLERLEILNSDDPVRDKIEILNTFHFVPKPDGYKDFFDHLVFEKYKFVID